MLSILDGLLGSRHPRDGESTVLYVFGLIWPKARIDCATGDDCYLVAVCDGEVRHEVRVPFDMVEFSQGIALVRAVYKSGIPTQIRRAAAALSVSL